MKSLNQWLLNALFKISDYPVLFRDLLEANALFNEGMLVDPAKLHYKFKSFNAYALYTLLCAFVLGLLLLITHYGFTKIDVHFSLFGTIIATSLVFIGFDFCKSYARKIISQRQIQKAWAVHFPHFSYEKYSKIVAEIYKEALKKEIPKHALENYILEQIVQTKSL